MLRRICTTPTVVQHSQKTDPFDLSSNVHPTSFHPTNSTLSSNLPAHQASLFARNAVLPELRQRHFSLPITSSNRPPIILPSNFYVGIGTSFCRNFLVINFLPLTSFNFFTNATLRTPCQSPQSRSEQVALSSS
jgi:hypothetical protein